MSFVGTDELIQEAGADVEGTLIHPAGAALLFDRAKDHKGFDRVIPTVVRSGRAVPFTDWAIAAPAESK